MRRAAKIDADLRRLCRAAGLPVPVPEHRFAPPRRWRFNWAWPDIRLALEVEGGVWTGGRHTRGAGFVKDMEKYNAATIAGWRVVRCTPDDVRSCKVVGLLWSAVRRPSR